MIKESAIFIRDELDSYLNETINKDGLENTRVLLGNISLLENNSMLSNSIVITLVKLEEETTLKNSGGWSRGRPTTEAETTQPPVYLNFCLLFTATLPSSVGTSDGPYEKVLDRLAAVVEFFQSKPAFTLQNSPNFKPGVLEKKMSNLELTSELCTLTFEQTNHLWGALGGKQSPFVMYKFRTLKIQGSVVTDTPTIRSVDAEVDREDAQ